MSFRSIYSSSSHLGPARSASVYSGSGGGAARISASKASRSFSSGSSGFNLADAVDVSANEKATMQNLNDRLASYLEKVRRLEAANGELELKIRQFLEKKAEPRCHDSSAHRLIISDLQNKVSLTRLKVWPGLLEHRLLSPQILDASHANSALYLAVDNAKLAADDFKTK